MFKRIFAFIFGLGDSMWPEPGNPNPPYDKFHGGFACQTGVRGGQSTAAVVD